MPWSELHFPTKNALQNATLIMPLEHNYTFTENNMFGKFETGVDLSSRCGPIFSLIEKDKGKNS